nr:choline-sulfatase-like [Nerophis lumbriciformis]
MEVDQDTPPALLQSRDEASGKREVYPPSYEKECWNAKCKRQNVLDVGGKHVLFTRRTHLTGRYHHMKNPNILFIQVDQMAAAALQSYGDKICQAPTLDRLAETGVVFERAYCNFPLCAPSRSSMATGQLCSAIGAYDNAAEFSSEIPTYAHYLREFGYQTSLSGKMHYIGPDQFHGFEKRLTADLYPADFSWVPNWGDEGKRDTNDARSVTVSGTCERSVQIDFDNEVTEKAISHLREMAALSDKRPFFMQVSYTHPHEPYLCKQAFWDLYNHDQIPVPRVGALSELEHDPHSVRLLKDFAMFGVDFPREDVQRARHAYYGSISYLDSLIEKLLETLADSGYSSNTAIVFTSDHGDFLGERGMWFKKHFYEPSLRVPLIIQAPWISPCRIDELVSLVDLLPTFNGFATGQRWESQHEELEDPDERINLARSETHAGLVASFTHEVVDKWNSARLSHDIRLSQKRRGLIRSAQSQGDAVRWNHGEVPGEKVRWYRGEEGYNEWAFNYLPVKN